MARRQRTYRTPVVITLAVIAPGCGLTTGVDDSGSGGAPGSSGGSHADATGGQSHVGGGTSDEPLSTGGTMDENTSTGGSTGGQATTGGASTGGTSSGGAPQYPECVGDYFPWPCSPEERCQLEFDCTSGTSPAFVFECGADGSSWNLQREACSRPAEYCAGRAWDEAATCQDDGWMYQFPGGNPPSPCPAERPAEAAQCRPGGFGGDQETCGYPCADGEWTVMHCRSVDPDDPAAETAWQGDGACSE